MKRMDKKTEVLASVRSLFDKKAWLDKQRMEKELSTYKPSEVHCLEFIGKHQECNVTRLAQAFYMTRGAISKITQKLIKNGSIERYQKEENKKEIYFRLTSEGKRIFEIHENIHQEIEQRDAAVYEGITEAQYQTVLLFLEKYNRHLDQKIQEQKTQKK